MNSSRMIGALKLLFTVVAASCVTIQPAVSATLQVVDTATNPANGHVYYLLEISTWTAAQSAAVAMGGNLVTINDLAENNWVWDLWGTNRFLWIGLVVGTYSGLGHASDFVWASGDPSVFRNWRPGEPNGNDYTYILPKGLSGGGQWNDDQYAAGNVQGVVEVEACSPHQPKATAILVNGFVVDATVTDASCGYTNGVPTVTIQGGGGTGATAIAVISNAMLSSIHITSAGCCYTNAPKIIISPPPFTPTVTVAVSRVKVTQHVVSGANYVLESSTNFVSWTLVGQPFTAASDTIVSEFDVDLTGKFFRLRFVP